MTLPDHLISSSITPRVHLPHARSRSASCRAVALSDPYSLSARCKGNDLTSNRRKQHGGSLGKTTGGHVGGVCQSILLVEGFVRQSGHWGFFNYARDVAKVHVFALRSI